MRPKNKLKAEAAERTTRHFPCGRITDEPSKAVAKHQSQTLFNIQTGKAASIEVKTCLLGIRHTGKERHKTFVRVCLDNPTCFEEPIKRVKLLTFKQECISNRRSTNRKIVELKCSRDLMGRLLVLATRIHLDLSHVFTFPLTPVPLSLCDCDGTKANTEKTALFRHLESKVESSFPSSASVDAFVVDGSFLLRVLPPNLPATYGKNAATIPIQATALSSKRVDIVFDTYEEPSIKGMERERRGACDRNYKIIGPQQTRPGDFNEALKSPSFKRELPTFLLNEWKEQAFAHIIHERHVYVGHLDECRHFYVEDGVVRHETIDVLGCNHAEADTRICLHARGIDDVGNANNIIIRASDVDIAVIMIHHAWKLSATLWIDTGTSNGKNRRYVMPPSHRRRGATTVFGQNRHHRSDTASSFS